MVVLATGMTLTGIAAATLSASAWPAAGWPCLLHDAITMAPARIIGRMLRFIV